MISDFCHFLTGRHCVAMTKTRKGIHSYSRANISPRNRPPKGWSRAPSPPRVRVSLSVVLGQCILESLVTQTPLHLTTKTHTLRVRATRAKHDRWVLMINGKCFLFRPHLGASPFVRASRPPTPLRGLGGRVFLTKAYRLVTKGFCVWAFAYGQKLYMHKSHH